MNSYYQKKYSKYKSRYLFFKNIQKGGSDIVIYYINPDKLMDSNDKMVNYNEFWDKKSFSEKEFEDFKGTFKSKIIELVNKFNTKPSQITNPDDYKLNIYEIINIPNLSHIYEMYVQYFVKNIIAPAFGETYLRDSKIYPNGRVGDVHTYIDICNNLDEKKKFINKFTENQATLKHSAYKIHLQVKYEYLFYAFLKIYDLITKSGDELFSKNTFQMKFNINSRSTQLFEGDTFMMDDSINGGSLPSIIIYSNENKDDTKNFIKKILSIFTTEEIEKIGFMDLGNKLSIPPFNVRLNKLICYTMGDRATKLDEKVRASGKKPLSDSPFKIPKWILDKIKDLDEEELNEYSKKHIGYEYCKDMENPYIYYLSASDDMLSPEEILL